MGIIRIILIIARWEYFTRIRSKWFIISTVILPIILVGAVFIPSLVMTGADSERRIIGIVDGTSYLGTLFDQELSKRYRLEDGYQKYQSVILKGRNLAVLKRQASVLLDSSIISLFLVIPEDILKSSRVQYYARNLGNFRDQEQIQSSFNVVVSQQRMIDANLNPEIIIPLTRSVDFEMFEVEKGGGEKEVNEILSYLTPVIFVMVLYFAIFLSSQILMRSVLAERTNRLVEILLSSVTAGQLMSGKILGLGLLGLTQIFFYMITGYIISIYQGYQIITSLNIIMFLVYFILGYLLYAGIFAAIGALFSSEHEAQHAVSILSIVTIIPILISSYVIANPQSVATVVLSFIPILTPFFMILRVGIEMPPLYEIVATVAILTIFVLITMLVAGKIFKTAILMYGKRPTLPEVIQWIKD